MLPNPHTPHLSNALNAHLLGCVGIHDLLHHLNLRIVVAGAERAQLRQPTLLGALANLGGVCVKHAAVLFAVLLVLRPGVAAECGVLIEELCPEL